MDRKFFLIIHDLSGKSRILDFFGVFFAEYAGYFLVLAAIILIWFSSGGWKKRFYNYSFLILVFILSRGLITETIRFFYHRPRPFATLNFEPLIARVNQGAFPSGHAAFYFALAGAIFLLNKKWGRYFGAIAFLIGLARIFVGVHWPSDILFGALIGVLSVWVVDWFLNQSRPIKIIKKSPL